MASFVTLLRDNSDQVIQVNLDFVIQMERLPSYTVLTLNTEKPFTITVKETPAEILTQSRGVNG